MTWRAALVLNLRGLAERPTLQALGDDLGDDLGELLGLDHDHGASARGELPLDGPDHLGERVEHQRGLHGGGGVSATRGPGWATMQGHTVGPQKAHDGGTPPH
jgi:hypothetical protein